MNKLKSNNIDSVSCFHYFLEDEKDEDLPEFHRLESYTLDCILLIQFALEDQNININELSNHLEILEDSIYQLLNNSIMPWELPESSFIRLVQYLHLEVNEVIEGLKLLNIPSAPIPWNQLKDVQVQFKQAAGMKLQEPLSPYARNYREQHVKRRDRLIQELQLLR
ncbi:hypothetical protein [Paenibacillus sp. UNC451MF]|uniref:hypothetical protein n=1 Tax=Paenibacillus sp. UNC451MF TaxID=1449063 RepID=UPI00048B05C2|nr:hypothetical protein [Paenibacillus sp. UNC451MF]